MVACRQLGFDVNGNKPFDPPTLKTLYPRSPVMLNEAKASRPELRGRRQDYEVVAEAKNNFEKSTK